MSGRFDMVSGIVIIINAIAIGYEASLRSDGQSLPDWLPYLEQAFLTIYICEFLMRLRVGGPAIFCNSWIHLDLALLTCGIADIIIRALIGTHGPGSEFLDNLMVIRVLRLARVARVFRLVNAFKTLWVLVNGLFHSMITLLWTFVLISIIMYCFAIFAIEVIKESPDKSDHYNETVRDHFSSLFRTCLTLLQGVTLDSVGGIYKPVILAYPALAIYFVAFIFIVSIALMNLVTAIMVQSALDQDHQDKTRIRARQQERRKRQVKQLKDMFHDLDADGSGMLSDDELIQAPDEIKDQLVDILETDDLEELFRLLDYDNDGEVSIDEFCEGVEKFSQGKLELFNITRAVRDVWERTGDILSVVGPHLGKGATGVTDISMLRAPSAQSRSAASGAPQSRRQTPPGSPRHSPRVSPLSPRQSPSPRTPPISAQSAAQSPPRMIEAKYMTAGTAVVSTV